MRFQLTQAAIDNMVAKARSLQAFKVSRESADLLGRKHVERGHQVVRLHVLACGDPGGERARAHAQRAGAERYRGSPTCVRSGPRVPCRRVRARRGKRRSRARRTALAPRCAMTASPGRGGSLLPRAPCRELRREAWRRRNSAIRACGPPQYSAHWPRNSPGRSAARRAVHASGNHVELGGEVGHPEAVDDVGRAQRELDRPPGRDANFVGGGEIMAAVRVEVMDPPPPLLADDFDAQRGRIRAVGIRVGSKARIRSPVSTTSGNTMPAATMNSLRVIQARRRGAAHQRVGGKGDDRRRKSPRRPRTAATTARRFRSPPGPCGLSADSVARRASSQAIARNICIALLLPHAIHVVADLAVPSGFLDQAVDVGVEARELRVESRARTCRYSTIVRLKRSPGISSGMPGG